MTKVRQIVLAISGFGTCALAIFAGPQAVPPDGAGEALPPGAIARLGSTRWRHGGMVVYATFLPGGKSILSLSDDAVLHVWQYPSGKELRRIRLAEDQYHALRLQAVGYRTEQMPVAVAPDGKTVAVIIKETVKLYDVDTARQLYTDRVTEWRHPPLCLAFSPDGRTLAVMEQNSTIRLWDWAADRELGRIAETDPDRVLFDSNNALVFSPNGKMIASSGLDIVKGKMAHNVRLWEVDSGKELCTIEAVRSSSYTSLVFSPSGKNLMFAAPGGAIAVVDTESGKLARTLSSDAKAGKTEVGPGTSLAINAEGNKLYAATTAALSALEWDLTSDKEPRILAAQASRKNPLLGPSLVYPVLSLSPDAKVLMVLGQDNLLHFLDVAQGLEIDKPAGSVLPLLNVQFSPDGRKIQTQIDDGALQSWVMPETSSLKYSPHPNGTFSPQAPASTARTIITYSADGRFAATANVSGPAFGAGGLGGKKQALPPASRFVTLFDALSGKEMGKIPAPANETSTPAVVFGPSGQSVAIRWPQERKIEIYDVASTTKIQSIPIATGGPKLKGTAAAAYTVGVAQPIMIFSPNGKALAAYADQYTLGIWSVASGQRTASLAIPRGHLVWSGAFSPDGRCLALDFLNGSASVYEIATSSARRIFTHDGEPPATESIVIVRSGAGANVRKAWTAGVAFAHNGQTLVHAQTDGEVLVWDMISGKKMAAFKGHQGVVHAVAVAADDKTLASASADTTVLLWDLTKLKRPERPVLIVDGDEAWKMLGRQDAASAYAAVCDLTASPEVALALCERHLKPAPVVEAGEVQSLIAQLDSAQYKAREKATVDLLQIGDRALPLIEKALSAKPSPEMQKRLEVLLDTLGSVHGADTLRVLRAVEMLERIATPSSRRQLQALAEGAPDAFITRTAREALGRMGGSEK